MTETTESISSSNLTNKYNPQELSHQLQPHYHRSNLTNKYNPQERKVY